jgi:hypothetical protein
MNGEVNLEDAVQELGRPIMFYRSLAKLIGIKESLLLCQLIYWTPRGRQDKGKGWIYKSAEEFEEETCLTYREQRRIRAVLVERGLIEEEYNREEHVMYFRVVPGGLKQRVQGPPLPPLSTTPKFPYRFLTEPHPALRPGRW